MPERSVDWDHKNDSVKSIIASHIQLLQTYEESGELVPSAMPVEQRGNMTHVLFEWKQGGIWSVYRHETM
jgi:hypothetical protein